MMKPSIDALLETIYQMASEDFHGSTSIKLAHLDQLRLEIVGLRMANAKLQKSNTELRGSVSYARDRIDSLNSEMAKINYPKDNFETVLQRRLIDMVG